MATFAITVDVSPLATALELYYTYVLPDGTISSPSQKYTGVGVGGFIALPPTPHPPGYTYTISNVSLNNNTVYNFEVKQFCVDNTIEYSPIDEDHYRVNCIPLSLTLGGFDYQNEVYPIVATWSPTTGALNPNQFSIQDYTLTVKYSIAGVGTPGNPSGQIQVTDTIPVPAVPASIPGTGYVYNILSDDLTHPLVFGEIYEVSLSFTIVRSDGSRIDIACPSQNIQLPYLKTYKIHGAEGWIVDWIDENNVHQRSCGGGSTPPNPGTNIPGTPCEDFWILVHHRYDAKGVSASTPYYPVCGYCTNKAVIFPAPYNFMYLPNPTVYDSDKVNCYPVKAGTTPNPSGAPCNNCGDNGLGNNYAPLWGATHHFIGDGYVTISGVIPPPACNVTAICNNAPSW